MPRKFLLKERNPSVELGGVSLRTEHAIICQRSRWSFSRSDQRPVEGVDMNMTIALKRNMPLLLAGFDE